MNYQETIEFLFPLRRFGQKLGLENIQALCDALGNPERNLGTIVHVAGTNGKGSVSAMTASICKEMGKKVGLYSSPHLACFTERIKINGMSIPKEKVAEYCTQIKEIVPRISSTFFEVTTALAFKYFAEEKVDVSVIETGIGGRLDATNVIPSSYSVITNVELEHTEWLGETKEKIAVEKADIIRPKSSVFTAAKDLDALEVITRTARDRKAKIRIASALSDYQIISQEIGLLSVHLRTKRRTYHGLKVPFSGSYQAENAQLAILLAEEMGADELQIRNGLANVHQNTGHRARLERVQEKPVVLLDVSHNPPGMQATVKTISHYRKNYARVAVVFAALQEKDVASMVAALKNGCDKIFVSELKIEKALPATEIHQICEAQDVRAEVFPNPMDAIAAAKAFVGEDGLVLITGSFYLAGEVLAFLEPDVLETQHS
ncbi:FolC bifunctional protein [Chloroherpeton thalassium ATCC 35110]|uniref:Dihydrofolate synthase/folylpolyglutamate synthase n=1 Tax=Chloroherpeton thalassium (strain ATCC 35110 / GB-78) TaxID=517418 RepID=B3QVA8_CHLT3|nr:folylpolyglutamate synthase/dihydrofolate synthase family protein [Chloroherpeton thalassium]ACF13062.1 FolC bifunctional protein [Chloroherpeton thalassium ATCC 35110]